MSKKRRRPIFQNVTYHIVSQCIEKKPLMKPDVMKDSFQNILNLTFDKYDFKILQYIIMDNHFHLLIKTTENGETISRIVQYIKARYAEWYNKKMNRTGPFWNGRFKCTVVEFEDNPKQYLITLKFYFGYNPVKLNIVNDPRNYKYSTFNVYFDKNYEPPVNISFHNFYYDLGSSFENRRDFLLEYEKVYRHNL